MNERCRLRQCKRYGARDDEVPRHEGFLQPALNPPYKQNRPALLWSAGLFYF